ncbi:MAG: hypothetical protein HeimC2_11630 [Candidatus Heimdallarchaeota archaeon LC_2]|nr:MAG: hypothetical protein HeimC2_11630 [Candidatus Heimdallarchaeota archaeon LC_2]
MTNHEDVSEIIYYIIQDNPGIHFRSILEKSDKQIGVVDYHLTKLEKNNQIISIKHRNLKLFFLKSWENRLNEFKHLIDALRKTTPRNILLFLAQNPNHENLSTKEVAVNLNLSPSNLHWHVKRLVEDKLIIGIRKGRQVTLKLNVEILTIIFLGNEIYPSKWERILDDIESRFGR